jgi:hypothetical protein
MHNQIVSDLQIGWIQALISFTNLRHKFQQHVNETTNILSFG